MKQVAINPTLFLAIGVASFALSRPVLGRPVPRKDGDETKIVFLTRGAGNYAEGTEIKPLSEESVPFASFKPIEKTMRDVQYGKTKSYRGIPLEPLVTSKAPAGADLALFHFENGMIIPVPLDDGGTALKKIDPFLALSIKLPSGKWSSTFPGLAKRSDDERLKDPRPIGFVGNKIVVSAPWHPFPKLKGETGFSPWYFASSLVSVEYVKQKAYYAQFEVASSPVFDRGMKVFFERCQYCHGVRQIGASFGWDYVDPLPTYKQKQPDHLFNHVKFPKADAMVRGLMMPYQKDMTGQEAKDLWEWMKQEAEGKQKPYSP